MQAGLPTQEQAVWYQQTVKDRNEKALLLTHEKRPDIMWGSLLKILTPEDRTWISGVLAAKQRANKSSPEEDEEPDYFPDEGYEGDGVSGEP